MKPRWVFATLAAAATFGPVACKEQPLVDVCNDLPPMVSVSPANLTVSVGVRTRMLAIVTGTCVSSDPRTVTWVVQDTAVASVEAAPDSAGYSVAIVTGRSVGSTILIATSTVDATVKAAAIVTVAQPLD
jgi:hypothetical protein